MVEMNASCRCGLVMAVELLVASAFPHSKVGKDASGRELGMPMGGAVRQCTVCIWRFADLLVLGR